MVKPLFSSLGSWTFRGMAAGFGLVGQHRGARARRQETRARRPDKAAARAKKQLVSCRRRKRRWHYRPFVARRPVPSSSKSKKAGESSGKSKRTASFLSVQKATLGTTGRCPEARSVLHCHARCCCRCCSSSSSPSSSSGSSVLLFPLLLLFLFSLLLF